jgi:predicted DNA-binding antitoxin AbrB/MazE fold protein
MPLKCRDIAIVVHAVYENGVFRPVEPVELPENCQVALEIHKQPQASSQTVAAEPLIKLAAIATAHPVNPDLPADLAAQPITISSARPSADDLCRFRLSAGIVESEG